jgi:hypothetical protein
MFCLLLMSKAQTDYFPLKVGYIWTYKWNGGLIYFTIKTSILKSINISDTVFYCRQTDNILDSFIRYDVYGNRYVDSTSIHDTSVFDTVKDIGNIVLTSNGDTLAYHNNMNIGDYIFDSNLVCKKDSFLLNNKMIESLCLCHDYINGPQHIQEGKTYGNGVGLLSTSVKGYGFDATWSYSMYLFDFDSITSYIEKPSLNINQNDLVQVFPNPFTSFININLNRQENFDISVKIFTILGQELISVSNFKDVSLRYNLKLDTSKLKSGVYFITIKSGNSCHSDKIIKF